MPGGHFFLDVGSLDALLRGESIEYQTARCQSGRSTHVWEEPRLGGDGGSGGGGRGWADAAPVVEGVARVRVVDVVALYRVVVESACRGGEKTEAQALRVGVAQGEAAAV